MGPIAGNYDPVQASFRQPTRSLNSAGEPVVDFSTQTFKRYIRFMRSVGREGVTGKQLISATQINVRLRRDSATEQITPDWKIIHRGREYGILSVNPIPAEFDEIELVLDSVLK